MSTSRSIRQNVPMGELSGFVLFALSGQLAETDRFPGLPFVRLGQLGVVGRTWSIYDSRRFSVSPGNRLSDFDCRASTNRITARIDGVPVSIDDQALQGYTRDGESNWRER